MSAEVLLGSGVSAYFGVYFDAKENGDPGRPPLYDQPFWRIVSLFDPMGRFFSEGECFVDIGLRTVSWPPSLGTLAPNVTVGSNPVTEWAYSSSEDVRYNASTLSSLAVVFHPFELSYKGELNLLGEHNCDHPTARGRILPNGSVPPVDLSRQYLYLYRMGNGPAFLVDWWNQRFQTHGYTDAAYWWYLWRPNTCGYSLSSFLKEIPKAFDFGASGFCDGHAELDYSVTPFGDTIIQTKVRVHIGGGYQPPDVDYTYEWRLKWRIRTSLQPEWWRPPSWGPAYWFATGDYADWFSIDVCSSSCTRSYNLSDPVISDFIYVPALGASGIGLTATPALTADGLNVLASRVRAGSLTFSGLCSANYTHFRPAAYLSTADAVSNLNKGTKTDVLQTLAKLPEYQSMVPKIQEFVSFCESVRREKLSPKTLKDLADIAASTDLQGSFQWRPLKDLLLVEIPRVVRNLVAGWDSGGLVIGRGSYHYDFLPTELTPYLNATITSRSKVVVDTANSAVFRYLMGLDGFGVLPKPSNLWDLIPYSFVVNWLTGVGALMRKAEYSVVLMLCPTYFVHSFTVEAEPTAQTQSLWQVTRDQTSPLRYRWYRRIVSRHAPFPSSTKFAFGSQVGNPPFHVVLSLLYQAIFR